MRILRSVLLAIGLMGLAVACGGSDKGGDTAATGNPCGANPCATDDDLGGDMGDMGDVGGGDENPCGDNPCGDEPGDDW